MKHALLIFLVGVLLTTAAPHVHAEEPPAFDLGALFALSRNMPGLSARFTEERQISLLAEPLHSEGTLHFARGRGLVRHTTAPSRQSVLVTDKDLVFWDGKTTRRVDLGSSVIVDTFVQAFSLLLQGNRADLEKRFALSFRSRGGEGWELSLTPKNADLAKVISSIALSGRGAALSTLVVHETNGDTSTTKFFDVDTNKRYSDEEAKKRFRVPPT